MDPLRVLGLSPGATPDEAAAAYRRLAKRWHPDRAGAPDAARRMAEINAAYAALHGERGPSAVAPARPPRTGRAPRRARPAPAVRRALGPELLAALVEDEKVIAVAPVAMWASPRAVLAVTDRRLLWRMDDVISGRVRSLPLGAVAEVGHRLSWPRRRRAVLRVRARDGRRWAFAELRPDVAARMAAHVGAALQRR